MGYILNGVPWCCATGQPWGGVMISWRVGSALYCFHCDRVNASGVCVSGERFCETTATEQCYVKKVYEGTTVLFGYQGCRNLCFPFMGCSHKYTVELTCCNSSSFCNKF
uniref:Secreted seminal-vesicle Ly-6 protein 1-like n=1 Tax=Equus asinus TaxID=9793 RepID=A0A9L0ID89_EQUAS